MNQFEAYFSVTNDDEGLFESAVVSPPIRLNLDKNYVEKNIMIDVRGCGQLNERTQIPKDAVFVTYDEVRQNIKEYIQRLDYTKFISPDDKPEPKDSGLFYKFTNQIKGLFEQQKGTTIASNQIVMDEKFDKSVASDLSDGNILDTDLTRQLGPEMM